MIFTERRSCTHRTLIRKVDHENRHFKDEWTDQYMLILPQGSTKPLFFFMCGNRGADKKLKY